MIDTTTMCSSRIRWVVELSTIFYFLTSGTWVLGQEGGKTDAKSPQHGRKQEVDLARQTAPPYFAGVLELIPIDVDGEIKLCPFLKEQKSGKRYRIRTYVGTGCEDAINNCKPGERCLVKGIAGSEKGVAHLFVEAFMAIPKSNQNKNVTQDIENKKIARDSENMKIAKYLENDEHFSFSPVRPGTFLMGSPKGEKNRGDNERLHMVKVTRPYQIGRFEVTQGQWKKIMGSLPKMIPAKLRKDSLPIMWVGLKEIDTFLKRLNEIRKNDGFRYRLPSEVEWEYAARGGQRVDVVHRGAPYSFGPSRRSLHEYANYGKSHSDYYENGTAVLPVGSKKGNPLDLYDIHGNVAEWTLDMHIPDKSKDKIDPKYGHPVNTLNSPNRYYSPFTVIRGGGWHNNSGYLRSASRVDYWTDSSGETVGFRLVRTAE